MSESRNKRINHIKSLPKYTKSNLGRYSVPPETNRLKEHQSPLRLNSADIIKENLSEFFNSVKIRPNNKTYTSSSSNTVKAVKKNPKYNIANLNCQSPNSALRNISKKQKQKNPKMAKICLIAPKTETKRSNSALSGRIKERKASNSNMKLRISGKKEVLKVKVIPSLRAEIERINKLNKYLNIKTEHNSERAVDSQRKIICRKLSTPSIQDKSPVQRRMEFNVNSSTLDSMNCSPPPTTTTAITATTGILSNMQNPPKKESTGCLENETTDIFTDSRFQTDLGSSQPITDDGFLDIIGDWENKHHDQLLRNQELTIQNNHLNILLHEREEFNNIIHQQSNLSEQGLKESLLSEIEFDMEKVLGERISMEYERKITHLVADHQGKLDILHGIYNTQLEEKNDQYLKLLERNTQLENTKLYDDNKITNLKIDRWKLISEKEKISVGTKEALTDFEMELLILNSELTGQVIENTKLKKEIERMKNENQKLRKTSLKFLNKDDKASGKSNKSNHLVCILSIILVGLITTIVIWAISRQD